MQSDLTKLFIGGISWDTDEVRLKEYFSGYGEVLQAVVLKDRITGRARGFGFVVFADPSVTERVIMEIHNIDGRMVEAKRAFPRENPISSSIVHGRTRKMFVGGLSSSVTETEFKNYFEQFGTITDAVVMYDHLTRRPRGFGFITYDCEEAVENALMMNTFHELNGKLVEVKRAVPKELSPVPIRSPVSSSGNSKFLNVGYSPITMGAYGLSSPISGGRISFAPFGSSYGMGLGFEPGLNLNPSFEGLTSFNSNSYGRGMSPFYIGNSNRFANPIGYDGGNGGSSSFFSSGSQTSLGNWGISPWSSRDGEHLGYGINDSGYGHFGQGGGVSERSFSTGGLFTSSGGYGDSTWLSTSHHESDDGWATYDYMKDCNGGLNVPTKSPIDDVAKGQNSRGITG